MRFRPSDARIVDDELLEIREDGQWELGGPRVAAKLIGGRWVVFEIDGGFLGFQEEEPPSAEAEGVIGGSGCASDLDAVLVNDLFPLLGVALCVVDVPAEGFEHGIDKFAAHLGFVVFGRLVRVAVRIEAFDEVGYCFGCLHGFPGSQFLGFAGSPALPRSALPVVLRTWNNIGRGHGHFKECNSFTLYSSAQPADRKTPDERVHATADNA